MASEDLLIVLLIFSGITFFIAIISLIVMFKVLKRQKELIKICKMSSVNSQVRDSQAVSSDVSGKIERNNVVQSVRKEVIKQGLVICPNCYLPIKDTCTVCPSCKTTIDRR